MVAPTGLKIDQTKRVQDKRGITTTDVRSHPCERQTIDHRKSPFRQTDEAAKSRRLPRGRMDIGGGQSAFGGERPDGGFLVPSFSRKSGIVDEG